MSAKAKKKPRRGVKSARRRAPAKKSTPKPARRAVKPIREQSVLDRAIQVLLTPKRLGEVSEEVKLHPDRTKNAFLVAYSLLGVVSYAANAASINRTTHYEWLETDDEDRTYHKAFAAAEELAGDVLEFEARRRATEGTLRPVFQQGQLVGYVNEYSDMLMALLLKGRRRNVFGDKLDMNHSGELKTSGVLLVPAPPAGADWAAAAAVQQAALIADANRLAELHTKPCGKSNKPN